MKKLIEALHVIQDECNKHERCLYCPLLIKEKSGFNHCMFDTAVPRDWELDKMQKALL